MAEFNWDEFEEIEPSKNNDNTGSSFNWDEFEEVAPKQSALEYIAETASDAKRLFDQGIMAGLTDEISAAAQLAGGYVREVLGGEPSKDYETLLNEERQKISNIEERSPVASTVGDLAGGMLQPTPIGKGAGLVKTAGVLGLQGALGGYGYSEADDLVGLAKDTAIGGSIGAATPVALNYGLQGIKKAGRYAADEVADMIETPYEDIFKLSPVKKTNILSDKAGAKKKFDDALKAGEGFEFVGENQIPEKILKGSPQQVLEKTKQSLRATGEDLGRSEKEADDIIQSLKSSGKVKPIKPLPEDIKIDVSYDDVGRTQVVAKRADGEIVGRTTLGQTSDGDLQARGVTNVYPGYGQQNLAQHMYDAAEKFTGKTVKPQSPAGQTPAGKRMWERREGYKQNQVLENLFTDPTDATITALADKNYTNLQLAGAKGVLEDYRQLYNKLISKESKFEGLREFKQKLDADINNFDKDPTSASKTEILRELRKKVRDTELNAIKKVGDLVQDSSFYDNYEKNLQQYGALKELKKLVEHAAPRQHQQVKLNSTVKNMSLWDTGLEIAGGLGEKLGLATGKGFESQLKRKDYAKNLKKFGQKVANEADYMNDGSNLFSRIITQQGTKGAVEDDKSKFDEYFKDANSDFKRNLNTASNIANSTVRQQAVKQIVEEDKKRAKEEFLQGKSK